MNTNTDSTLEPKPEPSPEEMQTALSLGNETEEHIQNKPNYMNSEFIKAATEFLQPNPIINRNAVAQTGDRNFYNYSGDLERIRDLLGAPSDVKAPIPVNHKSVVLDIVNTSKATKPLVFLIKQLWGLDVANAKSPGSVVDATPKSPVATAIESEPNKETSPQKDAAINYKSLLLSYVENKDPLNSAQLDHLISSLSERTAAAEVQSRQYLETMLYIGAGVIFFRFQCALLEKEKANTLHKKLLIALNLHFKKSTLSALDSIVGRIRRAYLKAMAFHLEIPEPKLSNKEALWALYKDSISEIPQLVARYYEGDLQKVHLKGIPYIPTVGEEKEDKEQPKKKPEWAIHIKMLKTMFEAAETKSDAKKPEFDDGFLSSTLFSLEKLTELLETQDAPALASYRDSIEDQINRLRSLLR